MTSVGILGKRVVWTFTRNRELRRPVDQRQLAIRMSSVLLGLLSSLRMHLAPSEDAILERAYDSELESHSRRLSHQRRSSMTTMTMETIGRSTLLSFFLRGPSWFSAIASPLTTRLLLVAC